MPVANVGESMYILFTQFPVVASSENIETPCPSGGSVIRNGADALYAACGMGKLTVSGKVYNIDNKVYMSDYQGVIAYDTEYQYEVFCNFAITETHGSICGRTYGGN